MITDEEISRIVTGIAVQFGKGKFEGKGWNQDDFEEYRQELFVKAYTLTKERPDIDIKFFATSMWNRAGDIFNKAIRKKKAEECVSDFDLEAEDIPISDAMRYGLTAKSISTPSPYLNEVKLASLIDTVLEIIETQSPELQKYVIAKLKLSGFVASSYRPDVEINFEEYDNAKITTNHKILEELLEMNNAQSGGTNRFKNEKRDLFLVLMSEFDVEDYYKKWYEVSYLDDNDNEQIECVKKFSHEEARVAVVNMKNPKKILSIVLDE